VETPSWAALQTVNETSCHRLQKEKVGRIQEVGRLRSLGRMDCPPQKGQIREDRDEVPSLSDYLVVFAAVAVVGRADENRTGVSAGMEVA